MDPLATGLLLVAFWNYTKLIPYFEKDRKTYEFEISLEGTTPSLDAETELLASDVAMYKQQKQELTDDTINQILKTHFLWEVSQIPPKYSALKIAGKTAHSLVRSWAEFEMKQRKITIYDIELLQYEFPKINLRASVSAGTYIRTIAWDFGDIVGTWGYITKLRRTEIWKLWLGDSRTLENYDPSQALNIDTLFWDNIVLDLPEEIITRLWHGQRVKNTLDIHPWEYFLKSDSYITHIIEVDEHLMKMKKKITSM